MGHGDFSRGVFAVSSDPRLPEPSRRVELRGILGFDDCRTFAGQPPQHRVDEAFQRAVPDPFRKRYRGIDGGMGRGFEKKKLSNPKAQDVVNRGHFGFDRTLQTNRDQGVDLSQPPQGGRNDKPDEGAIPRLKLGKSKVAGNRLVQSVVPARHGLQDFKG